MRTSSDHPYHGETVYFATKHQKEKVLSPLLARIGMKCVRAEVDTDLFGTFSGEVPRYGSVRETLRQKVAAASARYPEGRFFLASEGSFGPHPSMAFVQSDHEALLLVDLGLGTELYVEELTTETNHAEVEFGPKDDLDAFLDRIGFPEHGLIVKAKGQSSVIYKDLQTLQAAAQAIIDALAASNEAKAILSTDMRAHANPTRLKAIEKAGDKLIQALNSLCPSCKTPGFSISKGIPGLPCEDCGTPSRITKLVVFSCVKCDASEQKERPDAIVAIPASHCEYCNP